MIGRNTPVIISVYVIEVKCVNDYGAANHRSTVHQVRKSGIYSHVHIMETTRERVCQYYWKKVGMCYMYTPKSKPRKDIWHPKAQTENLITKYTAKARKKDVARRIKNK